MSLLNFLNDHVTHIPNIKIIPNIEIKSLQNKLYILKRKADTKLKNSQIIILLYLGLESMPLSHIEFILEFSKIAFLLKRIILKKDSEKILKNII